MVRIEDTLWCDGCGVEINWAPVVQDKHYFCCEDCAHGYACQCSERMDQEDERGLNAAQTAGYEG